MNKSQVTQKIKVNNGQELIAKAREYKNSGGEWKLRERYFTLPVTNKVKGWVRKNNSNGFKISNGEQTVEIILESFTEVQTFLCDGSWEGLCQLFPELAADKIPWAENSQRERIHCASFKRIKEGNKEYDLYRYLVAEDFQHLRLIIKEYFRENEAKIYNSVSDFNNSFFNWVEIIDGLNGNIYLYVGEKNDGDGREIKIGIKKEEFEKGRDKYFSPNELLDTYWKLLLMTTDQPQTPTEKEKSYKYLEETFQEQWPIRERLCRGYWESVCEKMEEAFNYWYEKSRQNQYYSDNEANEQGNLLHAYASTIKEELNKNKSIKICSDTCEHGLSKNNPSAPTSPKKGNSGKNENKSNQISDTEKSQILQYFIAKNISKISLENDKLVIEYNNNTKKTIENEDQELQKYHQIVQNLPNKYLSLSELQNNNNSSTPNQNNARILQIGLTVSAFILGGIFVYFLIHKKKK